MVLSLAECISYTVKGLCGGEKGKWVKIMDGAVDVADYICHTSKTISHEDLVSQRVAQNHTHKLPVPRPLDVLAALTAAVGRVILEGKGDPDRFST